MPRSPCTLPTLRTLLRMMGVPEASVETAAARVYHLAQHGESVDSALLKVASVTATGLHAPRVLH